MSELTREEFTETLDICIAKVRGNSSANVLTQGNILLDHDAALRAHLAQVTQDLNKANRDLVEANTFREMTFKDMVERYTATLQATLTQAEQDKARLRAALEEVIAIGDEVGVEFNNPMRLHPSTFAAWKQVLGTLSTEENPKT